MLFNGVHPASQHVDNMLLIPDEGSLEDPRELGSAASGARLVLSFAGRELRVDPGECVLLGSDATCDLQIERAFVSRRHVKILRRDRYFVAIDQSTNGVFLQTEDRAVTHFKRQEQRLWGQGWLALGETLSEATAVRFQVLEGA